MLLLLWWEIATADQTVAAAPLRPALSRVSIIAPSRRPPPCPTHRSPLRAGGALDYAHWIPSTRIRLLESCAEASPRSSPKARISSPPPPTLPYAPNCSLAFTSAQPSREHPLDDDGRPRGHYRPVQRLGAGDAFEPGAARQLAHGSSTQDPVVDSPGSGVEFSGVVAVYGGMKMRSGLLVLALLPLYLSISASPVQAVWPADGRALCLAPGDQQGPQAAPDGIGGAIVMWTDYRSGSDGDVFAQRVQGDGELRPGWPTDGLAIATGPADQQLPRLLSDGTGGAFVVWQESSSSAYAIRLQRVTGSGTIAAGWPDGGMTLRAGTSGSASQPQIVSDQASGVLVAWVDYRGNSKWDIYAQRVNGDGTIPSPWPVDGAPVTRAVGMQTWPQLVPDGSGGLLVAWTDHRTETDLNLGDVYAQRLTALGAVALGWPLDGVPICTVAGSQRYPCLVSDLAGGAVIVWEDRRSATSSENADIYAQRVTASGALDPAWPPGGVAVCIASGGQSSPRAVSDGVGGAIIAWKDSRTYYQHGILNAIHASRITATGALGLGWVVDGLPVCTSREPSAWLDPALAEDGAGGAFFAWTDGRDYRATYRDIYAQHLTATGEPAPGWDPSGILVSRAPGDQWCGGFASDAAGGVIVTWADGRNVTWSSDGRHGDDGIYCHRLTATGLSVPPDFALLAAAPNPMREASAIILDLSALERLHVQVYDVTGKRIRTLAAGALFSPGRQMLSWDARDDNGRTVGAGLYFVRVTRGAQLARVKLVRLP